MSVHTPGPWKVEQFTDRPPQVWTVSGMQIAVISGQAAFDYANARLIATAPELLEALKWAMRHVSVYSHRLKGHNEAYCDAYDAAKAAIAKAEGK